MAWLEAPISGTGTDPARSLGPAAIFGDWHGGCIYWLGPLAGTLVAVAGYRWTRWDQRMIEVAKIHHFDHDPNEIFHIRVK